MTKLPPVTFILGAGRSGTTLLRVMLDGHPRLFSPPELFLAIYDTMEQRKADLERRYWVKGGLRRALMALRGVDVDEAKRLVDELGDRSIPEVYAWLQDQLGDRMLVDKALVLAYVPGRLALMEEWFDQPRYVWIVRHPGAVVRSFQNMPMAEMMFQGYDVDFRNLWFDVNHRIGTFLADVPQERWTRIRYEDLVRDPRETMAQVLQTVGLPWDEAVLEPYEGDRMREGPKGARAIGDPKMASHGKIRPELAGAWLRGFDPQSVSPETRRLAKDLGYDLDAMPRPPIARVGQAMEDLFQEALALEKGLSLPIEPDDVEGRRFLLRMLSASLDTWVEHTDVDRPRFHHAEGPTRKMFADCPDTDYLRAPIRVGEGRVYRLSGRIPPGTCYVGVLLYGRGGRVARSLTDRELQPDAEGRFTLYVAAEDPGQTPWLKADGDENALMVRQYFLDREAEAPVEVELELLGEVGPPPPLDPEPLADGIGRATRMLRAVVSRTRQAYEMVRGVALNHFVEIPAGQLFPTPDNRYLVAWYRFGPDQVLVVRGNLPVTRYFGLSLCNAWMESLDYQNHCVNLNSREIVPDEDDADRFTVVLAHRDPGHPNWLDPAGHEAGYLLIRCLLLDGEMPQMETQVMYEREWTAQQAGTAG